MSPRSTAATVLLSLAVPRLLTAPLEHTTPRETMVSADHRHEARARTKVKAVGQSGRFKFCSVQDGPTCTACNAGFTLSGNLCKRHGGWENWGSWSTCTRACDSGTQVRRRSLSTPAVVAAPPKPRGQCSLHVAVGVATSRPWTLYESP